MDKERSFYIDVLLIRNNEKGIPAEGYHALIERDEVGYINFRGGLPMMDRPVNFVVPETSSMRGRVQFSDIWALLAVPKRVI